jgi:hypothetical protein
MMNQIALRFSMPTLGAIVEALCEGYGIKKAVSAPRRVLALG